VSRKATFGLLLVVLTAGLAQGVFLGRGSDRLGVVAIDMYERPLMATNFARSARFQFAEAERILEQALRSEELPGFTTLSFRLEDASEKIEEDLKIVEERRLSPESMPRIAHIRDLLARWRVGVTETMRRAREALATARAPIAITPADQGEIQTLHEKLRWSFDQLVEGETAEAFKFRLEAENTLREIRQVNGLALGITLCLGALILIVVATPGWRRPKG
jgi:hypothetical protein